MSVSFVNGYTCYSSCDAAAARSGKDPHPNTPDDGDNSAQKTGATRGDAVQFGGALADLNSRPAAPGATGATTSPAVGSQIDLLA